MSTVEAMGTNLPAIGVRSPGASDIIEHGKTGYLAYDSIASLTAMITFACLNKKSLKKMGAAARKASEQYAIERTSSIMLSHYTRLAQSPKPKKQKLDERLMSILEEFINPNET
jgi:glycosyltransferase involved in cell wall biosynthesis